MAAHRSKLDQERLSLRCLAEALATDSPASAQTANIWIQWAAASDSPLRPKGLYGKNRLAELATFLGQACASSGLPQPTKRLTSFLTWARGNSGSFQEHSFLLAAARAWLEKSGPQGAEAAISFPVQAATADLPNFKKQSQGWSRGDPLRSLASLDPNVGAKIAAERPEAALFLIYSVVAEIYKSGLVKSQPLLRAILAAVSQSTIDNAFVWLKLDSPRFEELHDVFVSHGASWTAESQSRLGARSLFSRLFYYRGHSKEALVAKKQLGPEIFWRQAQEYYRKARAELARGQRRAQDSWVHPAETFRVLEILADHEDLPLAFGFLLLQDATRYCDHGHGENIAKAFSLLGPRIQAWPQSARDPWRLPGFALFEPHSMADCEPSRRPRQWHARSRSRQCDLWRSEGPKGASAFSRLCQCFGEHRFSLAWPAGVEKPEFSGDALRCLEAWEIMDATVPLPVGKQSSPKPPRL